MKFICILFGCCLLAVPVLAQQSDTLQEIVISANKFAEKKKNVAQQILVLTGKNISRQSPANSADLLQQSGQVFVQRSQQGGGSPVLRGFEASRVLMMIDGVRMNNAMYRAGHLQNVITIDPNMLERVEVMYGPASTMYGSDALGGVMHFYTRQPVTADSGRSVLHGNAAVRYATANNGITAHASLQAGFKRWGSLTGVSISSFGDLLQGSRRSDRYPDFGKLPMYAVRNNNKDTFAINSNPDRQRGSGYRQQDFFQKILFTPNSRFRHLLNLQVSTAAHIPRYDRLSRIKNNLPEFAEWYYGQHRSMAAYTLTGRLPGSFFSQLQAGVNYQYIQESRHERKYKKAVRENRVEKMDVMGFNIDLRHVGQRHELSIGTDGQYNRLRSVGTGLNVNTGEISTITGRYPNGKNHMTYTAAYAAHTWKLVPDKLVLNDGLRVNHITLRSNIRDNSKTALPFTTADNTYTALSGNLGIIYMPVTAWRFSLSGATGFRAPNIDDLGKIFDSQPGMVIVPNPQLKPEYTYNLDLSLQYSLHNILRVELTGFYTWFRDVVVTDRFTFNGMDSIEYGHVQSRVMANQNKARAFLYGVYAGVSADLGHAWHLNSTITYTRGRYQDNGVERPLDHIPPVYGKTAVQYEHGRFYAIFSAAYNGWKDQKDYNMEGEDNFAGATPEGMPAWYVLDLQTGIQLGNALQLQLGLENLTNRNYRVFASGISAPGRNLVITLRSRF